MKFKQGTRRQPIEYEKDLVKYWKENKTFEKSVEQRPESNSYVFYDGPPFITGLPHHGTLLVSIIKDAVPRYWTMKGKRIERVWGWDCHGLPAETFTEKKLGIKDRRDIGTKISLEEYIVTCRENMVQTGNLWEDTIDRIGRWVDFKGAYKTMDKEFMESVWWAFKQLYEKGKIYEGEKVLLYCTRDATPVSKAEVAMDNSYQDVTDPSVYVKFKLKDSDTSVLAWTTTPWTLPANTAVALNADFDYTEVSVDGQKLILATELLDKVLTDDKHQPVEYKVLRKIKGKNLVGKSYEPLFEDRSKEGKGESAQNAHKIWHADYVSLEEGTGIVHLAPAYGEEDFELAREQTFPVVSTIDDNGFYTSGEWKGQYVWDANKPIAKALHERGDIWKVDYIRHSYPHCWRCGTKLMYRAHPSWFMDIEGQRAEMLEENGNIEWFPSFIKHGRFENIVRSAPDWNISRDRFWATAMPVWKGTDKNGNELVKVIGSYAELKQLSGVELDDYHRPWIDDVTFVLDGIQYKRVDKVMDSWFEAGSMSFAQFHYPFENSVKFEQNFPADFITEYIAQTRTWFYYLHTVSIGLFGKSSFNNVIVTGTIAGNDGRKMSKSYGNYTDPNELMDSFSADALRFLLLSSPLLNGEDYALIDKDVADVNRKLAMVWNMYDFFTMYAAVDDWEWEGKHVDPTRGLNNSLDKWIVSRAHQLTREVDKHMQGYDLPNSLKPVIPFIEDASNWYVRRSRRRFWKSGDDKDKDDAYRTLHYVLTQLSIVLAPFTPFLAEELYRKLTGGESVHLLDWPEVGHINDLITRDMSFVREVINEGLSQRAAEGIKVRQPLQSVSVLDDKDILNDELKEIIKEELNVKEVFSHDRKETSLVVMNLELSDELKREGIMREVVRHIQNARKQAGLQVDDRINLGIHASAGVLEAIQTFEDLIKTETLAKGLAYSEGHFKHTVKLKVGSSELTISLEKA